MAKRCSIKYGFLIKSVSSDTPFSVITKGRSRCLYCSWNKSRMRYRPSGYTPLPDSLYSSLSTSFRPGPDITSCIISQFNHLLNSLQLNGGFDLGWRVKVLACRYYIRSKFSLVQYTVHAAQVVYNNETANLAIIVYPDEIQFFTNAVNIWEECQGNRKRGCCHIK